MPLSSVNIRGFPLLSEKKSKSFPYPNLFLIALTTPPLVHCMQPPAPFLPQGLCTHLSLLECLSSHSSNGRLFSSFRSLAQKFLSEASVTS